MFSLQQVTVNTAIVPYGNTVMDGMVSRAKYSANAPVRSLCKYEIVAGILLSGSDALHFNTAVGRGRGRDATELYTEPFHPRTIGTNNNQ